MVKNKVHGQTSSSPMYPGLQSDPRRTLPRPRPDPAQTPPGPPIFPKQTHSRPQRTQLWYELTFEQGEGHG